jgi:glucose 1-dehydrogenase
MPDKLDGKAAVVTGGDRGIGRDVAIRLAQEGADVAIVYRANREGADQVVREIERSGRRSVAIQADVGRVAEAQRLISESAAYLNQLSILINNAGVEKNAPFWEVSEADFDQVLNTNLKGLFFVTQAFVNYLMQVERGGKIINISSVHEELPFPHFSPYCASKGGVKMITRTLAIELAPMGITVNSVTPGAIKTPINQPLLNDRSKLEAVLRNIPLHRLGEPSDVAGVVAFLACADADYITGASIVVDGGLMWNYQEQ